MTIATKTRKDGRVVRYVVTRWKGRRYWERVHGDAREAARLDRRRQAEAKAGTYQPPAARTVSAGTVGDYLDGWAKRRRNRNAGDDQKMLDRHVKPTHFASLSMLSITPGDVEDFVDELLRTPAAKGGTLSPKTVANLYGLVRTAFADAERRGLIDRTPCSLPRKKIQRRPATEKQVYSAAEVGLLCTRQQTPSAAVFAALCLLTGMREGEVCGLCWCDYDADAQPLGGLVVSRQYDGQPLKTDRPRVVPVHKVLAGMLGLWRTQGFELTHLRAPKPTDPILPRKGLMHHTRSSAYKLWIRCCESAGVDNRSLHSTRHTFITLLRRAGANVDAVETITHNAAGTIVDRYTHWQWDALCEAVSRLVVDVSVDARVDSLGFTVEAPGIEPRTDTASVGDSSERPALTRNSETAEEQGEEPPPPDSGGARLPVAIVRSCRALAAESQRVDDIAGMVEGAK